MKLERKRFSFEIKTVDVEAGTFSGYAAIFSIPDDGMPPDIIVPGAFAKTIKEWGPTGANRIKILALHRSDWLPIGAPTELVEDAKGLSFTGVISKTSLGLDVLTLMRDRVLTEMSIGFDVIKQEPDKMRGMRLLQEVRLWEISPVTWAMHPLAGITDVKAIRATDRDLYALALSPEQPDASTASDAAAERSPFDPECLQSIKALTAQVHAAISRRGSGW
ncbi:MAG: HK97 family phage prohead protease [Nitrospira sp.]|nr:HK97 family phage prohead protease [Nitrospira sp.]